MTDQSQQEFSIDEVMAQAAARFGGGDYQTIKQEEENAQTVQESQTQESQVVDEPEQKNEQAATNGGNEQNVQSAEQAVETTTQEVKQAEIDPMLKALLDAAQPKTEEKQETEVKTEAAKETEQPKQEPTQSQNPAQGQIKTIQPNDLLTDGARKFLQEYKDLDEQSFNVMDLMAEAHSKAQVHNLEQAVVQVVQQLQGQIAQQNQIISELKNQLAGVHTKVTAPTLDDDITAMKADPLVAAYLPYMQNILNGQDINAKMQLVNTWKSSKSTTNSVQPAAPVTQAPVVERRTSSVSAAAEATAALANKTQGSMVQPSDPIEEGMRLAQERFGLNRK